MEKHAHTHVTARDPRELKPHPLKKLLPRPPAWDAGGEALDAFCDNIQEQGIITPLLVDRRDLVLDGGRRLAAALQLKLPTVPVLVTDAEPASAILSTLLQRKHLTKSALAFLAYPLLKPALEEARKRMLSNLAKNPNDPRSTLSVLPQAKTVEELAERIGISRVLAFHAQKVHALFEKDTDYRDLMLPKLLGQPIGGEHEDQRPVGLGAVLAGYEGRGNKDRERPPTRQLELFSTGLGLVRRHWMHFDDTAKEEARSQIRAEVAEMPEDLREEFARAIREAKQPKLKVA